jgi:putative hydrolase of the HAD superfamily
VSIRIPDRVVVFDYGEVISVTPTEADRAELLKLSGAPAGPFWESYWKHRDELDRGSLNVHAYWTRVATDLGTVWSESDIQKLWACDFRGWISVDPGTTELLADLHEGGTRIALLSNAGFDFASPFRYSPIGRLFERIFLSAEMDAVKPDPAIYLEVIRELGISIDQLVFIDNKSINTDAAEKLGATVHHFTNAGGLREFLTALAR